MLQQTEEFKAVRLKLASPEDILNWSYGEVTKPETINYRTQRPEKDGLFDEKIFGPIKDWECYCGKYKRIRYKGIICDKCGVEVTRAAVRRERMGHIKLAAPVAHIWFLRGVPSRLGLALDLSVQELEKVVYFAAYIITSVDEEARAATMEQIEREFKAKRKEIDGRYENLISQHKKSEASNQKAEDQDVKEAKADAEEVRVRDMWAKEIDHLESIRDLARSELKSIKKYQIISELEYRDLSLKYGPVFQAGIGAAAINQLVEEIDLEKLFTLLQEEIVTTEGVNKRKLIKRLKLVKSMIKAGIRPDWMIISNLPVIPPDLRPMVQLDGGRFAASDLNDLYRRVINRKNRLKKLLEIGSPEVITRNEKRMLQEAVDALIDNSIKRGSAPVASQAQRRPLRSLADMLKGKQGRFRQNLLGKRVDYSGRSVIVVGPELKLHQCGLPKHMALELFKPFVINKIIERELAHNIRGASRLIDEATPEIWAILEEVIRGKYVLLNRAPTLHRLGIQAFQPLLIEGNAIQLHPLVCAAFNADFDGDQMAVHVPLTDEAQKEAAEIIASTRNLLKPGSGEAIAVPTQDMVLGCYWLTKIKEGAKGEGKIFASKNEAVLAYDMDDIDLRALIKIYSHMEGDKAQYLETSVGRVIFNMALPSDYGFVNEKLGKKPLTKLIGKLLRKYGQEILPPVLDKIKETGFKFVTKSGISWGMDDLRVPVKKPELIENAKKEVAVIAEQYETGLLTEDERYKKVVEVWSRVKHEVSQLIPQTLDPEGPVFAMVDAAARGSWDSVSQMSGMKGLMRNPSGRIIELPVLSSYKEGFSVLEYFISTHGARKGTADTALKTAVAGYLTRRLVDVAQDVVVSEVDCGENEGVEIRRADLKEVGMALSQQVFGRTLAEDIKDPKTKKVLFKRGHLLSVEEAESLDATEVPSLVLRSPILCKTIRGVCQMCYGYDLGSNMAVKMGEAVGIVAAQAIGEPGTQLTMKTFHLGGVAGASGDITLGLPRVEEVFEVRIPKNKAIISELDGTVIDVQERDREKVITVLGKNKKGEEESIEYVVPFGRIIVTKKGNEVTFGTPLSDGPIDINELFTIAGPHSVRTYILNEVSKVYTLQGATINNKHIEVMIRQMLSRLRIKDAGDTSFVLGEVVDRSTVDEENNRVIAEGGAPAKGVQLLMGITKVALTTSSFLSAASFMETGKVLIRASLEGRKDRLLGLKENVIVGHLIPAGTGFVENPKEE